MLGIILLAILILMLAASLPWWPYARRWGYGPAATIAVVFIITLILQLDGRL